MLPKSESWLPGGSSGLTDCLPPDRDLHPCAAAPRLLCNHRKRLPAPIRAAVCLLPEFLGDLFNRDHVLEGNFTIISHFAPAQSEQT